MSVVIEAATFTCATSTPVPTDVAVVVDVAASPRSATSGVNDWVSPPEWKRTVDRPSSPVVEYDTPTQSVQDHEVYMISCLPIVLARTYQPVHRPHLHPTSTLIYEQRPDNCSGTVRVIIVDWLVEIVQEFKQSQVCLHSAVNLFDRYMLQTNNSTNRPDLQCIAVTCFWLAAKFDVAGCWEPEVNDLAWITTNICTVNEIKAMEIRVLTVLNFEIGQLSLLPYEPSHAISLGRSTPTGRLITSYLMDYSLFPVALVGTHKLIIWCAATMLAKWMVHKGRLPAMQTSTDVSMVKNLTLEHPKLLKMVETVAAATSVAAAIKIQLNESLITEAHHKKFIFHQLQTTTSASVTATIGSKRKVSPTIPIPSHVRDDFDDTCTVFQEPCYKQSRTHELITLS